jgi:hypothetical protein
MHVFFQYGDCTLVLARGEAQLTFGLLSGESRSGRHTLLPMHNRSMIVCRYGEFVRQGACSTSDAQGTIVPVRRFLSFPLP